MSPRTTAKNILEIMDNFRVEDLSSDAEIKPEKLIFHSSHASFGEKPPGIRTSQIK